MTDDVLAELVSLERALLDPTTRYDAGWLDAVLDDAMVEFGKSGRIYDKPAITAALSAEKRQPAPAFRLTRPVLTMLGPDAALLTYRLDPLQGHGDTGAVPSLRSSVWRRSQKGWQLLFHQGTAAKSPPLELG